LDKIAAAFDYEGPAATLMRQLKYGGQSYLAQGAGAYLTAQFLRLEWPMPDYIIPVPMSFMHWLDRGYNQSLLLAESMGEMIQRPVQDILYRRSGDYSQAGLSRWQRQELDGRTIRLNATLDLRDKTVLLVDDVMTTGSTIRKCAEVLMEAAPARIYGLVLCKAV
jgi:ComF family protein